MKDDKNPENESKKLTWLILGQVFRLIGFIAIAYFLSVLFVLLLLSSDNTFFISNRTRLVLNEAQQNGIGSFLLAVLNFDKVAILTGCGIYFYNFWKMLEKNDPPNSD